jgi:hypothetical protein
LDNVEKKTSLNKKNENQRAKSRGGEELDGGNSKGPFENMGWRTWKIENQVTNCQLLAPLSLPLMFLSMPFLFISISKICHNSIPHPPSCLP